MAEATQPYHMYVQYRLRSTQRAFCLNASTARTKEGGGVRWTPKKPPPPRLWKDDYEAPSDDKSVFGGEETAGWGGEAGQGFEKKVKQLKKTYPPHCGFLPTFFFPFFSQFEDFALYPSLSDEMKHLLFL